MHAPAAPATERRSWVEGLSRHLPIQSWLPHYQRAWLWPDLIAGLTVVALLIPEGMAYAQIAGMPPQAAFYAAPIGLLLFAVLGNLRQLCRSHRSPSGLSDEPVRRGRGGCTPTGQVPRRGSAGPAAQRVDERKRPAAGAPGHGPCRAPGRAKRDDGQPRSRHSTRSGRHGRHGPPELGGDGPMTCAMPSGMSQESEAMHG